jgi:hypothetical protein
MGGLLSSYRFEKEDPFISSLSQINSLEIEEALSFYVDEYPNVLRISYRHFDDIFGGVLKDVEMSFKFFANEKKDADLLEIFAVLIIGCRGTVNWKVKMLFCLFDFDNSENIDKNELSLIISAFTKALSKLCNGTPPTINKLYLIASHIFKEIDKDNSLTLELQEIIDWSEQNLEFQEFMAHFSHIQSLELATMKFNEALEDLKAIKVPETLTKNLTRSLQSTILGTLNSEELELFYRSFTNEAFIHIDLFEKFSVNVIAFIVSDYTNKKSLDKLEIQIMMSLISHQEKSLLIVEDFMRRANIPRNQRLTYKAWIDILNTPGFRY